MKRAKRNRPEAGTSERVSETAVKQYTDDDKIIVLQAAAKGKRNFSQRGGAPQCVDCPCFLPSSAFAR